MNWSSLWTRVDLRPEWTGVKCGLEWTADSERECIDSGPDWDVILSRMLTGMDSHYVMAGLHQPKSGCFTAAF